MKKPRVMLWDIEISPNVTYTWPGKYDLTAIAFKKEWSILSIAWKWLGDDKIHAVYGEGRSEKNLLAEFRKEYCKADVTIAHNGDKFDTRKLRTRLLYHKLPSTPKAASVDTLKVARAEFGFNSNSLADLGEFLGLGKKAKHSGFETWLGCMAGKRESWDELVRYNMQDVKLLEKVYRRFLPWMETHPSLAALQGNRGGCPKCGSKNVMKNGIRPTAASVKQRWSCKSCGGSYALAMPRAKKK